MVNRWICLCHEPVLSCLLSDLSYQAAQHVLSAPVSAALHLLKDTSQNFPTRARSVLVILYTKHSVLLSASLLGIASGEIFLL